jgi:tRNA pseudouridine38-40 synthase
MRTLGFIFEYDGTAFSGWQVQPAKRTVHVEVRKALHELLRGEVPPVVHCSGRTDAGVHARYQVAHVLTESAVDLETLRGGLRHFLPADIALLSVADMPPEFHARRTALSKTYAYRILNRRQRSALDRDRAWHVVAPLDRDAMMAGASALLGRHDFASFQAANSPIKETVRTMYRTAVEGDGDEIIIRVAASGFLKYMVRNIVGTLVEMGQGRRAPEEMPAILKAVSRPSAGRTAPPQGLFLERVHYPEPHESALRAGLTFRNQETRLLSAEAFYTPAEIQLTGSL